MMRVEQFINQNSFALLRILPILLFIFVVSAKYGTAAGPLNVYVVNYPLKYFADRIGGDHVKVVFPVPADVDPAYWHPDLADIAGFQAADLILLNGAGYARWVAKVSLPQSKIVDTSKGFNDRYITTKEVLTRNPQSKILRLTGKCQGHP